MLWQTMNNDNCKRFMNLTGVNTVSPNGAMFYTLRRDSAINIDGDDLCYDGLHPNHGLPMFALASVFYQTFIAPFYDVSIDQCTWLPKSSDKRGPFNNSVFRTISDLQKDRIYQYVHMSLDNRFGFNDPLPIVEDPDWIKVQGTEIMNVMPEENGYGTSSSGLITEYSGYDWDEYDIRVTCRYGTNQLMYAGCFWGENDTYLGGFWKSSGTATIFDKTLAEVLSQELSENKDKVRQMVLNAHRQCVEPVFGQDKYQSIERNADFLEEFYKVSRSIGAIGAIPAACTTFLTSNFKNSNIL